MWKWKPDGLIKIIFILKINQTDGLLLFAFKDSLKDKVYMYVGNDIVYIYEDTTIAGNLDAGSTGNNSIKTHGTAVATAYAAFKINNGYNSFWDFQNGNHSQAWSNISIKGSSYMSPSHHDNIIIHTRIFVNWHDDRLKENGRCIENACETLSKPKPLLYDKKPDMDNDDPTTWHKKRDG